MSRLTFSIIINTYNRATSLVNTLESMFYLRHPAYEVIVVNGPSTDHTQALIEQYAENIKIGQCAETNLAKSRNIGIGMASGDIVCFIDDDGIPEPDWLDQLEQVYLAHPEAGGVGGFVRDHTGVDYQTKYIVCNRQGEAQFYYDEMDASVVPQSPWQARYPSLIGVNSSFRRQALLQIGGFDEEYAYFLDETDVCVRLVDAGWQIMFAPKAEVHHKYAPSHLRNNKKVPTSLFYTCRSKVYFLFRNATPTSSFLSILREANNVRHQIIAQANGLKLLGAIDAKHHASLLDDGERGFHDGVADAFAYPAGQPMPAEKRQHLSFKACLPRVRADLRLNVILLSREYPPTTCGGIGVFVHRLAEALAAEGHEVSVITKSLNRHTVDFENRVWVHRIVEKSHGSRRYPEVPDIPLSARDYAYSVYDEAVRIQSIRGASMVISAIWDLEGIACVASQAFQNIVYLVTTYQLSLPSKPEWQQDQHYLTHHVQKMIQGEHWMLRHAQQVIASTPGILRDVCQALPDAAQMSQTPVIPFGLPDVESMAAVHGAPTRPVLLYVGRFELRKGVDLLLNCLPALLAAYPDLEVRLVGHHDIIVNGGTLKDQFLRAHAGLPGLDRVKFLGAVSETELHQEYAQCSLFVAPSRYESFGLIYLEAMRYGKPCIGSDAGGIPDVLTPDVGLLPQAGNQEALLQAICTLLDHPEQAAQMGRAGRQRFVAQYSMPAFLARLTPVLMTHAGI